MKIPSSFLRSTGPAGNQKDETSSLPSVLFRQHLRPGYEQFEPVERLLDDEAEYIEYQEPSKEELLSRVEYDIDEQDEIWLRTENLERSKQGLCLIDYNLFERVMDRLEKEWFDLVRDQVPELSEDDENNGCAVCDDGECENSNAIVFCDGCNVAVHQDCYGVPYIPEGQWLCRRCMISPDYSVKCIFCPVEDGALKQTDTGKWAHVLCAIWIPECSIGSYTFMEPITGVENIPRSRWKLLCYLCRQKCGASIQCNNKHCYTPFHASCARKAGLYMHMRGQMGQSSNTFRVYCDKHTPKSHELDHSVATSVRSYQRSWITGFVSNIPPPHYTLRYMDPSRRLSLVRSRCQNIRLNPPEQRLIKKPPSVSFKTAHNKPKIDKKLQFIIPDRIFEKIVEFLIGDPQDSELLKTGSSCKDPLVKIFRYWSLKREDHRGAFLSRRLYLEPWTADTSSNRELQKAREDRNRSLMAVRNRLEAALGVATLVKSREEKLLKVTQIQIELCQRIISPVTAIISPVLEIIMRYPVSEELAPDYYLHVKRPMDFTTLTRKVENFEYEYSYELFERDLDLIWTNCMFYNKSGTEYWKAAHRYRKRALQHVINSRGEVLRKKLITSMQWHALLRANYTNIGKSRKAEPLLPVNDDSASAFPNHYSSADNKTLIVSLGHSLLSSTSYHVLNLLWKPFSVPNPDQIDSIEVFNPQVLHANFIMKNRTFNVSPLG